MDRLYLPGQIVADKQTFFDREIAVFGIVLPKNVFLKKFVKEKGEWPTGIYDDAKEKKFGLYLPFSIDGEKYPISISHNAKKMILPSADFLYSDRHVGAKFFGEVYSPNLERKIGFEVVGNLGHLLPFGTRNLEVIHFTIGSTGNSLYSTLMQGAVDEMHVVGAYFDGQFKNLPSGDIKFAHGTYTMSLVELLRECDFPESYEEMEEKHNAAMRILATK